MGDERQQPSPRVSRRDLFRKGREAVVATGAAALLARVGTGAAEAASPTENIRHLEEVPDVDFRPIQIEGEPIEASLATGPKGYWFHANNGQVIETLAEEVNGGDYVGSSLYNASGFPVEVDMHTRTQATIPQTGDYFLVVKRRSDEGRPEADRFQVQVKEVLEHGIQVSFLLHPNKKNPHIVRFPNETTTVLAKGDFGVILDFNELTAMIPPSGDRASNGIIRVYAQRGGPEQVTDGRVSLPEDAPANEINYWLDRFGDQRDQRVVLLPVVIGSDGKPQMVEEWPSDSHIAVVVDHPQMRWVARFFILEKKGAPKG